MTAHELIEILNEHYGDMYIVLEEVNDLLNQMFHPHYKFAYDLGEEIEEYALDRKMCPLCGGDIVEIDEDFDYIGNTSGKVYGCEKIACPYIID